MHYHVVRDGQQLGKISEADLRGGLLDGRFLATDLVWQEGMTDWVPLGSVKFAAPPAAASGPKVTVRRPGGAAASPATFSGGQPPASGLALTSLISGIVSIFLCGVGGVGSLVAIICGHRALSRINQSGGVGGKRGMALTGLILGYVSLVLVVITAIAMMSSMAVPIFSKIQERGMITKQINNAKQVNLACKAYAAENGGKYPASLEELVEKKFLEATLLEEMSKLKPVSWMGEAGFEYLGMGKNDTALAETEILVSNAENQRGERIIACYDGSVALMKRLE